MKTQCPNCKSRFNVGQAAVGKQAKCPKCSSPFTIEPFTEPPAANPQAAAPATEVPAVKIPQPVKEAVTTEAPSSPPAIKEQKPQPSGTKSESKPVLPKNVFVYLWAIVRIIAGVLGGLGLMMAIRKGAYSAVITTFIAADVFLILGVVIELVLYYKMWAVIQDDDIPPAKAVLFLFIPFFNIYWMLSMLIGFAEEYNSLIEQRSTKIKALPVMLFVAYAFSSVLAAIVITVPMLCVFVIARRLHGAFTNYAQLAWTALFFASAIAAVHFIAYILVSINTCNAANDLTGELKNSR
ncbi:MAG: hypothetical protein PHP01_05950 [Phycisphaerae bacterium]|nr:hypothetical protein [Phycisphaerae bacterium]